MWRFAFQCRFSSISKFQINPAALTDHLYSLKTPSDVERSVRDLSKNPFPIPYSSLMALTEKFEQFPKIASKNPKIFSKVGLENFEGDFDELIAFLGALKKLKVRDGKILEQLEDYLVKNIAYAN